MTGKPPLDPWRFDAIANGPDKIWGLGAIARALGVSEQTVRRWTDNHEGFPVYRPGGRWFAVRAELNAWLRCKT